VDLFQFYQYFPIDDHSGDPITDAAQVCSLFLLGQPLQCLQARVWKASTDIEVLLGRWRRSTSG
jgi:hypothetical protein